MKFNKVLIGLSYAASLLFFSFSSLAQTGNPGLDAELGGVRDIERDAGVYLREAEPKVINQQQYEQSLYNACNSGNSQACTEYNSIQQRKIDWLIENDCRYRTSLNRC